MANPLVQIRSNQELDENPDLRGLMYPDAKDQAVETQQLLSPLAAHLRGLWTTAKRAKTKPETRMAMNQRAANSEYEPDRLAAIIQATGSTDVIYMGITQTKCRATKSWIKDYLFPPDGKPPFQVLPTPIPELPPTLEAKLFEKIVQWVEEQAIQRQQLTGMLPTPEQMKMLFKAVLPMAKDQLKTMISDAADKAAQEMQKLIEDQFTEGGWFEALDSCLSDLVELGTMILRGPVYARSPVVVVDINEETGAYEPRVEDRIIETYRRVSPFMFYPSPDSSKNDIPWCFEKVRMTRRDLASKIGSGEGFDDDAIREILRRHDNKGLVEWTNIDDIKHRLEGKDSVSVHETELIDALFFQGSLPGRLLMEWDIVPPELVNDTDKEYEVEAWLIAEYVIKAIVNPDLLGKKNIFTAGFGERTDSIWHKGVPELVEPVQTIGNAAIRMLRMNMGMAGGPQVEVNVDRLAPGEQPGIVPFKIWRSTTAGMMESPAVKFYQPTLIVDKLMDVYRFCLEAADDDTGIPRYFYSGNSGAQDTASGYQMQMANASKGLKAVIRGVDTGVIEPSVRTQYHRNLQFEKNPAIVGDVRVLAKGSAAILAREQSNVRKMEVLDRTNNPTDNQIMGLRGRALLLHENFKAVGLDADKILDDEAKIQQIQDGVKMLQGGANPFLPPGQGAPGQAGQAGAPGPPVPGVGGPPGGGPGHAPPEGQRALDAAGKPVAGRDSQEFESTKGSTP